jgi:hypothetical protein
MVSWFAHHERKLVSYDFKRSAVRPELVENNGGFSAAC